jgi:hypothetical protein
VDAVAPSPTSEQLVVFRDRHSLHRLQLGVVLSDHVRVDGDLSRSQSRRGNQLQVDFAIQIPSGREAKDEQTLV